jgi:hypothetical protein
MGGRKDLLMVIEYWFYKMKKFWKIISIQCNKVHITECAL